MGVKTRNPLCPKTERERDEAIQRAEQAEAQLQRLRKAGDELAEAAKMILTPGSRDWPRLSKALRAYRSLADPAFCAEYGARREGEDSE